MLKPLRFGIDCDGVLAVFDQAYAKVLIEVTGKDRFPCHPYEPPCWDWCEPLGYSKDDENKAWDFIKQSPRFWRDLPAYEDTEAVIMRLNFLMLAGHEVYFITNRLGNKPKLQTELFLTQRGMALPTVLVTSDKGPVIKGLKIDAFIDDKPSNCVDAAAARAETQVFLLDRPWNQEGKVGLRVKSVHEMLDRLQV